VRQVARALAHRGGDGGERSAELALGCGGRAQQLVDAARRALQPRRALGIALDGLGIFDGVQDGDRVSGADAPARRFYAGRAARIP
jgi:hypothetical protein